MKTMYESLHRSGLCCVVTQVLRRPIRVYAVGMSTLTLGEEYEKEGVKPLQVRFVSRCAHPVQAVVGTRSCSCAQ